MSDQETGINPDALDATDVEAGHADEAEAIEGVETEPEGGPIVASANRFFNGKWIVFGILLLAGGAWFAYDGLIGYPAENERIAELTDEADAARLEGDFDRESELRAELKDLGDPHTDNDLRFQVLLGVLLPIGGLALIGWTLYAARGQLKLDEDDVLHVAGHPPVPLSAITDIDDERWDKKGVSRIAYEVDGKSGVLKIDDFIFERPPTDKIHDRVVWVWKKESGVRSQDSED